MNGLSILKRSVFRPDLYSEYQFVRDNALWLRLRVYVDGRIYTKQWAGVFNRITDAEWVRQDSLIQALDYVTEVFNASAN